MSDKQLAIDTIRQLPDNTSMEEISRPLEFLAAIRKGLDQVDRGETVPHDEVKRQLASWLSK
jgi:predicted transcriptional regulator